MTFGLDPLRVSALVTYIRPGVVYSLNTSWSHHQTTASPAGPATAAATDDSLGVYLSRYRGLAASGGACVCTVLQNGRARAGPLGGCGRRAKLLDAACELVGSLGHGCRLEEGGGHCGVSGADKRGVDGIPTWMSSVNG